MAGSKLRRRLLAALLGALGLAVAVPAGGYLLARTESGRDWIADRLSAMAGGDGVSVVVTGLGPGFPFSIRADRIAVRRDGRMLADVRALRIDWRPFALLSGILRVNSLTAEAIDISADASAVAPAADRPSSGNGMNLPVDIALDRFAIGRLSVAAADGVRAEVRAAASLRFLRVRRELEAKIDMQRLDRPGHVRAEIRHIADPARFELHADIEDAPDGLIGTLAGLPGLPALSVRIDGTGPANGWRGTVGLSVGGAEMLKADLDVAVGDETRVGIASTFETGALLPSPFGALTGPRTELTARLRLTGDTEFRVDSLRAVSDRATLDISGRYGIDDGKVDATAALKIAGFPALPALGGLAAGGIDLSVKAAGAFPDVSVTYSGAARDLAVADSVRIAALDLAGSAVASKALASIGFDGRLRLADARVMATGDAAETVSDATLDLSGRLEDLQRLAIDSAKFASPVLGVRATNAQVNFATGAVKVLAEADVPDFAALAALRPHADAGALTMSGDIDADLGTGRVGAVVAGRIAGLKLAGATLPAGLAALSFSGQVRATRGGPIEIVALQADSALARVSADASIDPKSGNVRLTGRGTVADLGAFSDLAGVRLGGAAGFSVAYAGTPPDAGGGGVRLSLARPSAGPVGFDTGSADITVGRDGGVTRGEVSFSVAGRGGKLAARSAFLLSASTARLSGLRIESALVSGGGDVSVPLGKGALAGDLRVDVPDISALAAFAGVADLPLAGRLAAQLNPVAGSATAAAFRIEGTSLSLSLSGSRLSVDRILATGTATGLAGEPAGKMKLVADGVRAGDRRVRRISADIDAASLRSIGFAAVLRGVVDPATTLNAAGRIALSPAQTVIDLTAFDGLIAGERLKLGAPARAAISDDATAFDLPELRLGDGTARLSGRLSGTDVRAKAALEKLPLSILNGLGILPVSAGTLDATAEIAGAATAPDIDLKAQLSGLSFAPTGEVQMPVLAAEAAANVRRGVLTAKAEISAPGLPPVTLSGTAGTPASNVYAAAADMTVDFRVSGGGPLGPLMAAFLPDGDRGDGQVAIDLSVAGTVAAPEMTGSLGLTGMTYESREAGTIVKAGVLELKASGRTVEIARLAGTDGGNGRFAGEGAFRLSPAGAVEGSADLTLTGFRAARRDDAIADLSGRLKIVASAASLDVTGTVTVDQADILIPDRLPDAIHEIRVEEIRNGKPVSAGTPEKAGDAALPVKLAVAVDLPGRVFVRGRGLVSEWKGNIEVTGNAADPVFGGKLTVANGTFAFAGKRFVIGEGTITLPTGADADPRLNVTAEATAGDILARVTVEGPASAPRFAISSEPSLPREEVLSWILFGKSTAHLSPVQAAQLAESAATISGATGSGGVFDRIRRATGLDVLDVESGGDSPTGSTLKAGKYVADGVFVSAGQGIAPGTGKVGVEIELAPFLSIETEAGSNADSSIGVNLKYDF